MSTSVCKRSWSSLRNYSSTEIWLRETYLLSRLHFLRWHISQICFQSETTTCHWISISYLKSIHSTLLKQLHTLSQWHRNTISIIVEIIIYCLWAISITDQIISIISWTMSLSLFWTHLWLQCHWSYNRVSASMNWVISLSMRQHSVNQIQTVMCASSAVKRIIFWRSATINSWLDENKMW